MSAIWRGSLPANFDSLVASGMLRQPEPQYFFAKLGMAARLKKSAMDAGVSTVQQFVSLAGEGAAVPNELDQLIRIADERLPDAIFFNEDDSRTVGDTIRLQRVVFAGGGYSEASRLVHPGALTSEVGQSITTEEVSIALKQFEGPFNTALGKVSPYEIPIFDAKKLNAQKSLIDTVSLQLNRDYMKWLDAVVKEYFFASGNMTLPSGVANAAAFTNGGTKHFSLQQIADAKRALRNREWSSFQNGRYACIVPTDFQTQMLQDPIWRELTRNSQNAEAQKNPVYGFIGSYQDVDFYEVSNTSLKTYGPGAVVPGALGGTVAASVNLVEAVLIGPGGVGMVSTGEPKPYFSDSTNFGKRGAVIWRAEHGFQTLDDRAIQRITVQV